MHFEKMMIELELTAPIVAPKTVIDPVPTPASATSSIQRVPLAFLIYLILPVRPCIVVASRAGESLCHHLAINTQTFLKGKGKAKAMEDDEDEEGEATQKLRKELKDFVVLTKAAKAFLEQQGKLSQFFVLEGYKGKGKAKALLGDSEQMGAKQSFKSTELVDSNSDENEEEDRVCVIKKIKHEHVEEPTGARKRKETIELEDEVEIVVPKTPAAGPLH
ncbi:hypothetical protein C0995_008922 [Termitomyces sp. Mi166|nr:hypothetical protein C0995_008922 [Termitomyces sp. Mi166\